MDAVGLFSMGVSIIGGLSQAAAARRAARKAQEERDMYEGQIRGLEASRQQIIDPYANVKDLSSMITNPFANLQVATKAAEMQAAEQDISLATTLETLRATGASAGGATALAQAASRSKAQIAASIEQQEAQNMRLKAQGEQRMQQIRMQEAVRLQQADVAGTQFKFSAQEQRDIQKLNRLSAMAGGAAQRAASYGAQASAGLGQALGSAGMLGYSILNK